MKIQDKLRAEIKRTVELDIMHMSAANRIDLLENALQAASATIEEYERKYYLTLDQRDDAVYMLAEWCIAVEEDTSWDGWDDCYKNAMYRPCSIRELIDAEIEVQKDQ